MKKIFGLLISLILLNGCAESVALLGSSVGGVSNGKIIQSSLNSAISYGTSVQLVAGLVLFLTSLPIASRTTSPECKTVL